MNPAPEITTTAPPQETVIRFSRFAWFRNVVLSDYLIIWLSVLYFAVMALWIPGFASQTNLHTIFSYMLPLLVVSVGLTYVLIIGGIDLSVTSIIALASVVGGKIMSAQEGWLAGHPMAVPAAIAAMLCIGIVLGAVNGCAVTLFRIPAFIATLTTMMFVSGFAIWVTLSRKIGGIPSSFLVLGQNFWIMLAIAAGATLLAHIVLSRTLYGRWLYAIGQNARAALISGVPVARVSFATYMVSGLFAGISAILFTAALETGNPEMARDNLLDVIGAVVIGGTSLYGGKGRVLGTIFGVLFLALVDNSLNLLGLTFYSIIMIKGVVILLAAILDSARTKFLG
jgi:ribose/xylose/arabinose/galactoside ABC-type transport system permease subunit